MKSKTVRDLTVVGSAGLVTSAYIKANIALLSMNQVLAMAGMIDTLAAFVVGIVGVGLWLILAEMEDDY